MHYKCMLVHQEDRIAWNVEVVSKFKVEVKHINFEDEDTNHLAY
jgi:hypothetical protein